MKEFSIEYLRKRALDRWENEGGAIVLDARRTLDDGYSTQSPTNSPQPRRPANGKDDRSLAKE